jgi:Fe-S-cluster-containing hydrogenase component 2
MKTAENMRSSKIFIIYGYRDPEQYCGKCNSWEMQGVKSCPVEALKLAKNAYDSQEYERVEIYQRYLDKRSGKMQDKLYRQFGKNKFWALMESIR